MKLRRQCGLYHLLYICWNSKWKPEVGTVTQVAAFTCPASITGHISIFTGWTITLDEVPPQAPFPSPFNRSTEAILRYDNIYTATLHWNAKTLHLHCPKCHLPPRCELRVPIALPMAQDQRINFNNLMFTWSTTLKRNMIVCCILKSLKTQMSSQMEYTVE